MSVSIVTPKGEDVARFLESQAKSLAGTAGTPPLTEQDVRRIVREELIRARVIIDRSDDI